MIHRLLHLLNLTETETVVACSPVGDGLVASARRCLDCGEIFDAVWIDTKRPVEHVQMFRWMNNGQVDAYFRLPIKQWVAMRKRDAALFAGLNERGEVIDV